MTSCGGAGSGRRRGIVPRKKVSLIPPERLERSILLIRDERVMVDFDLATLYGVETRQLVQAVKRNRDRFPSDFAFSLTQQEFTALISQIVISNGPQGSGGRRTPPMAFTEQGVAMLSSVLRSSRAVAVNVEIMRTFVRLRKLLASHADLAKRLDELESKYDKQFAVVFDAIRRMIQTPAKPRREIGYHTLIRASKA